MLHVLAVCGRVIAINVRLKPTNRP
ncbi:hypothetical protein CHELA1G11_13870 [Hyphomicrobiales bacterium]|nr:hypothetical protein CHELA1G11_13870 [Hyphomicrobiales bacterium]